MFVAIETEEDSQVYQSDCEDDYAENDALKKMFKFKHSKFKCKNDWTFQFKTINFSDAKK